MRTPDAAPTIRDTTADDVPAMFAVRTSVIENHQSEAQLRQLGITHASVTASLAEGVRGWVAEAGGRVVGFSVADLRNASIFAVFVLPVHERRGHGTRLLDAAVAWLRGMGIDRISLETGSNTTAEQFYLRRGWRIVDRGTATNDVRMVLDRP